MRFLQYYRLFLSSGCATLSLSRIGTVSEGSLRLAGNIENPNLTLLSHQKV